MASYDPNNLLQSIGNTERCGQVKTKVFQHYNNETEDYILRETWEDSDKILTYPVYTMNFIRESLETHGLIAITLENGTGCNDSTFDHVFILFRHQGIVYRLESYVFLYTTRVLDYNNYLEDLLELIAMKPGENRVTLWNKIFSAQEKRDTTEEFLDVIVTLPS